MKKKSNLYTSLSMLVAFALWTIAVKCFDVRKIGPKGTCVGFGAVNALIHKLTGVHMWMYYITDWLGLVPVFVAAFFALLGLVQWIKRKKLSRVDKSIFVLGGFYIAVMLLYIIFEMLSVNYRPVLIKGALETSYPSSTTLLVLCVMPTAIMQINNRIKNKKIKNFLSFLIIVFIIFMIAGRLISGVHWFTDIVGGALISACLVEMYRYINQCI